MRKLLYLVAAFMVFNGFCYEEAADYYGVSPLVVWAIAGVESSHNQSAVHINRNGTYDVGTMQINSVWRSALGETRWQMAYSDPCYNVFCGTYILRHCVDKYGYNTNAIACYNTGRPLYRLTGSELENGKTYVRKVMGLINTASLNSYTRNKEQ
jgi:soluble lytic murein transglycosylase-like protein